MQHTTLTEYKERKDRLIEMYVKGLIKEDVFEAKNKKLDDLIEKTKQANKAAQDLDRNWYEVVGRTLKNLKDPKAKMDAAMDVGEKRAILQSIGPNVLAVERKIGKSANGRNLTAKFIEVKPYPWLEFLEKSSKKLAPILSKGLINALRGENWGLKTIYTASGWAGRIRTCECWDQNPVPYRLATAQSFSILAQLFYFVEEVELFEVAV